MTHDDNNDNNTDDDDVQILSDRGRHQQWGDWGRDGHLQHTGEGLSLTVDYTGCSKRYKASLQYTL